MAANIPLKSAHQRMRPGSMLGSIPGSMLGSMPGYVQQKFIYFITLYVVLHKKRNVFLKNKTMQMYCIIICRIIIYMQQISNIKN